jgi:hypothetical protein
MQTVMGRSQFKATGRESRRQLQISVHDRRDAARTDAVARGISNLWAMKSVAKSSGRLHGFAVTVQ